MKIFCKREFDHRERNPFEKGFRFSLGKTCIFYHLMQVPRSRCWLLGAHRAFRRIFWRCYFQSNLRFLMLANDTSGWHHLSDSSHQIFDYGRIGFQRKTLHGPACTSEISWGSADFVAWSIIIHCWRKWRTIEHSWKHSDPVIGVQIQSVRVCLERWRDRRLEGILVM